MSGLALVCAFFYIANLSKLPLVSTSEFCHQITLDGNEMLPYPSQLFYYLSFLLLLKYKCSSQASIPKRITT